MSILDKFEKGVEGAVNGVFAKIGARELKPIDIVTALKKEVDDSVIVVGRDRNVVPNQFRIELSTADFDRIEGWGPEVFADELASTVHDYALSQQYVFIGSVAVIFEEDESLEEGNYLIKSQSAKDDDDEDVAPANPSISGAAPLVSNLPLANAAAALTHPTIELGGQRYILTQEVTVIGRGSDCDVILEDNGISRHHLEFRVTPGGTIASDMGSTNGMFVEGHQVPAATLVNGNTISIGRTRITYWEQGN